MGKCRYNLLEDCHNKDCLACVFGKVRAEIDEQYDKVHPYNISCAEGLEMALGIIDKHLQEVADDLCRKEAD